jgi:GT2 family glycosyltransferase
MQLHEFSVLVIAHGRAGHLRRLLAGVDSSLDRPAEVVVVYMDEPTPELVSCGVPLRIVHISSSGDDTGLPLARARNAAAAAAKTANLVFLDVDCIPSAELFRALVGSLLPGPVLAMAEPRYLRRPLEHDAEVNDVQLRELSVPHRARAGLPMETTMSRHEMFWSLGFAITASSFAQLGRFDEGFSGYGGEDTDFAFRAREAGLSMRFVPAKVFHQHHGVHKPPLNHFASIIDNARRFYARWHRWPMEGWLEAFTQLGLIDWHPGRASITIVRAPSAVEVEAARSLAPY